MTEEASSPPIPIRTTDPALQAKARALAERWSFQSDAPGDGGFQLVLTHEHLELRGPDSHRNGPIFVDWIGGRNAHRRRFGGGRGQPLARAVGLKGGANPGVIDATAGMGRDAFVLACLGCRVTMIERSPVIAALLGDALERAARHEETSAIASEQLRLVHADAREYLEHLPEQNRPDVVYLDPMYPEAGKSSLPKKEMQAFRQLLSGDPDSDALLPAALGCARQRVVVKRPVAAPPLGGQAATMEIRGKKHRYDVYVIKAMQG